MSTKIFLCHSSDDKPLVRELYKNLVHDKFDVWLDEENIFPGQDWETEITQAVKKADIVVICLSRGSINKSGYIQKEIRFALAVAEEKPDGVIFIIPARIEECVVPNKLRKWQWVDLFRPDGYKKLLISLQANLSQKDKTSAYSEEIGTRIQSGLANIPTPTLYIPFSDSKFVQQPPKQLTIIPRSTRDKNKDRKRVRGIYGTLISFHGRDKFAFQVFENGNGYLIDFPADSTRICEELLARLRKVLGSDKDFYIEPIQFQ